MINPRARPGMTHADIQERPNRQPVSIITGFLGSGKTTLLNHLVQQPSMDSVALIINEFGEIGLDNLLVESSIENTLMLENGCICCSVRGDLIDTVVDLYSKVQNGQIPAFSRILIETTGLAEPGPIINTLENERVLAERCRLDCVVTLIDGVQGEAQSRANPEAMMQIAQADIGLISKGDLIDQTQNQKIRDFALAVNPTLEIETIEFGQVPIETLFGRDQVRPLAALSPDTEHHEDHDHGADQVENRHEHVSTWSFVDDGALDRTRLFDWLRMIYSLRGHAMLRLKGLVRLEGEPGPLLVQAVGPLLSPAQLLPQWPGGGEQTKLVFIVKGLPIETLRSSFERHVVSSGVKSSR